MSKFSFRKKKTTQTKQSVITNELEFNPYNSQNRLISKNEVQHILQLCDVDYEIQNLQLFQTAFIDKSYSHEYINSHLVKHKNLTLAENKEGALPIQKDSYERLEFLGDSIIELASVSYIFQRFTGQNEKLMHRVKTNIVDRYALSKFAKVLGMNRYLVLSKQAEDKRKRADVKKLCDIFEAFMGALYQDVNNRSEKYRDIKFEGMSNIGFQICEVFYINIVEAEMDFEDIIANDSNHKSKLIQYYQHNFQITPTFKVLRKEVDGDDDDCIITMSVFDNKGEVLVTADGETEKQAEQNAARVALEKLKAFTINE
jgi:ribonuclease-3